jgi:argininosuccinate lyase
MTNIRGRFSKPADKQAAQYTASLPFDQRLYPQDIAVGEDKVLNDK